jgi:hypothetical protein
MKKRLCAATVGILAFVSALIVQPAYASPAFVEHTHFDGGSADAFWQTGDTTTSIQVSKDNHGDAISLWHQTTVHTDSNGNFTGLVDLTAIGLLGIPPYTFTIDSKQLTRATMTGSGVLAEACTYDANFNKTECHFENVDISLVWTGVGAISATGQHTSHFHTSGVTTTVRYSGRSREAVATGTFAGLELTSANLQLASLGVAKNGSTYVCVGVDC